MYQTKFEWHREIWNIHRDNDLERLALQVFRHQYDQVSVYRKFAGLTDSLPENIHRILQIPFLPVSLFKQHVVTDSPIDLTTLCFESSTTTGQIPSKHFIINPSIYQHSFTKCFESFFGSPESYAIVGLLPSYLERGQSSLVNMVHQLIERSGHPLSGFYLHNHAELFATLQALEVAQQPTLLFGVTYALLDFAATYPMPLQYTKIIETGGMKGRREEMNRTAVHRVLKEAFDLRQVCSEYGMTELLSQAYSLEDEWFCCPPWMKILVRDPNDPKDMKPIGRGLINLIDLANIHSCSFISTDDIGEIAPDGRFKVHGRLDFSEWRGCSLLAV